MIYEHGGRDMTKVRREQLTHRGLKDKAHYLKGGARLFGIFKTFLQFF